MKSVLEPGDIQGPTWARLKAHLQDRLTSLRQRNDNATLSYDETQKLRGRIAECKYLLALGSPTPPGDND